MKLLEPIVGVGRARDGDRGWSWDRLQNIGVAVLAVIAVVGVVLVMRPPDLPEGSQPVDVFHDKSQPSASASHEPTTEPSGSSSVEPTDTLVEGWVTALGGTNVLRAPAGTCEPGGADVTIDRAVPDEGWQGTEVPGLLAVTGLRVDGDGLAKVVGAGADCELVSFTSDDGGETWREASGRPQFWSLLPGVDDEVASPAGRVKVPCTPSAVSGLDGANARVWCESGTIEGTASSGDSWAVLGSLDDAAGIVYVSTAEGFALATEPDCVGISVLATYDGGTRWEPVHCSTLAGPWGIAADGSTVAVIGADAIDASGDGGETWPSDQQGG